MADETITPLQRRLPFLAGGRGRLRVLFGIVVAVFAALVALQVLPLAYALGAVAVVGVAVVYAARHSAVSATPPALVSSGQGQEQILAALIASMPDAAIVLGREGRVLAFNQAARGIAPALAVGAPASSRCGSPRWSRRSAPRRRRTNLAAPSSPSACRSIAGSCSTRGRWVMRAAG